MLLAQISDLHIKQPGALAYRRVDTAARLSRTIARLNALAPRPDAVVITGDLVDRGSTEEYLHLKALLAPLELPYWLMVGKEGPYTSRAAELKLDGAPSAPAGASSWSAGRPRACCGPMGIQSGNPCSERRTRRQSPTRSSASSRTWQRPRWARWSRSSTSL